ncbi:DUF2513 domain-containing protein [Vagococcus carniphilus]|uniref:DUF2513 domain-containing protein n=1 Tax=Vagococcus carniphilus TaxID=218144 RepID=UPI00288F55EB|nr:DUF2513 domain-containing protein [Vagococcus carniphilus]MDT2813783.1 DUF2513 domain-containing protein [Vagococcus carniphilus]
MKLNHDCVRQLLIDIEETMPAHGIITSNLFEEMTSYKMFGEEQFSYTLAKLKEADYITARETSADGVINIFLTIDSITWDGHKFLDTIKSDTVWIKTKDKVVNTVGSTSLQVIASLATKTATNLLGL